MSEDHEPDWLAELAKGGEALQREAMRIIKAAEEFTVGGPARPLTRRIVRAVSAGIRELAAPEPVVHELTLTTTVTAAASLAGEGTMTAGARLGAAAALVGVGTITATGSIALTPMSFSGRGAVENPSSGQAERSIGQILAVVLVLIVASGLLGVQGPDRAAVDHYLTVIGVALPIAMLIWSKQNKPK